MKPNLPFRRPIGLGRVSALVYLLCGYATATQALTLPEAWAAAQRFDAPWRAAQAQYAQVQEKVPQARAQLLPNVAVRANSMHNQRDYEFRGGPSESKTRYNSNGATLEATAPLWNKAGWAGLEQAEVQVVQGQHELAAAKSELAIRLIQAYTDVLLAQEVLRENQALKTAYARQTEQARARFERGMATAVDTHEAQAKYDQAAADTIDAANALAVKRTSLSEIVGDINGDLSPLPPTYAPDDSQAAFEGWLALALRSNPLYLSKQQALRAAEVEVNKQQSAYWPTVDLVGSYGRNAASAGSFAGQPGNQSRQLAVGLQLNIPLYAGGSQTSKVREARAALEQSRDELDRVARRLSTDVKQAFLTVMNGKAAILARTQAVRSADTALQSSLKGRAHGVRTELDTLLAQQQVTAAQKELSKTQLETLVAEIKLRASAGALPDEEWHTLSAHAIDAPAKAQ